MRVMSTGAVVVADAKLTNPVFENVRETLAALEAEFARLSAMAAIDGEYNRLRTEVAELKNTKASLETDIARLEERHQAMGAGLRSFLTASAAVADEH